MDHIFATLQSRGWLMNNCYQQDDGLWRMNLRKPVDGGDLFTDFSEGYDLESVLEDAMLKIDSAEFEPEREIMASIDLRRGQDLLQSLGLIKPAQPFTRRF